MRVVAVKSEGPRYKGVVERFFGRINEDLLADNPGRTLPPSMKVEDYDPQRNAVIRLTDLEHALCKWIVEDFGKAVHAGIGMPPLQKWREGVAQHEPRLPTVAEDLDVLLSTREERTVDRRGIEFYHIHYNSEALAALRRRLPAGGRVSFAYDPTDMSRIHVLDQGTKRHLEVPAVDPTGYTQGLSLWCHRVISRYARQKGEGQVDIVSLARSKEAIRSLLLDRGNRPRSAVSGARLAHYLEGGGMGAGKPNSVEPSRLLMAESRPPTPLTPVNTPEDEDEWTASFAPLAQVRRGL